MLRTDRLKELRKNARKTQKDVSELIGVASSTYSMYERGEREPDFEKSEILIIRGFEASDLTQYSFEKPSIEFLSLLGK